MVDLADLRRQFPHPQACPADMPTSGTYCVGGALCLTVFQSCPTPFPAAAFLAEALRAVNHHIDATRAREFARAITSANDADDFEKAWLLMSEALIYSRPTREATENV